MTINYKATVAFGKNIAGRELDWESYSQWMNRQGFDEVVSLDGILNSSLIDVGDLDEEGWAYVISDGNRMTGFYSNLDFVIGKVHTEKYNLLAVAVDPDVDCRKIHLDNFGFVGYDLLDDWYHISSITNCDGFVESYSLDDINEFGLFDDWQKACDAKYNLLKNNPEHPHADTHVIGVWRHLAIGR